MGALTWVFIGWVLFAVAAVPATAWWCRRLWKKRQDLPRRTKAAAFLAASSALAGALGTLLGLVKAFAAIGGESVDPSQRARVLAEGISEAINWTAFGFLVWLASTLALLFLTSRDRRRAS